MMQMEHEIEKMVARRGWWFLAGATGAAGMACLGMLVMGCFLAYFKESQIAGLAGGTGDSAGEPIQLLVPLSGFAGFLLPMWLLERYLKRFKVLCPSCHQDILPNIRQVQLTRCCTACTERILSGRAHSEAAWRRRHSIQSRHFLKYWLWSGPAFTLLFIAGLLLDGSAFQHPYRSVAGPCFGGGFFGAGTAGYSWLRTWDRRYVPPLVVSVVFLGLGAFLFWRTL